LFVYICITVGESIIKRERIEISLISLIPPHLCVCLKTGFPMPYISLSYVTPSLFIEVPVPSQESEQSYFCELGVSILPLSKIFLLEFGTVLTGIYCFSDVTERIFKIGSMEPGAMLYEANREFMVSYSQIRYEVNREFMVSYSQIRYEANREFMVSYSQIRYEANMEFMVSYS
jgi:hypothetical protein